MQFRPFPWGEFFNLSRCNPANMGTLQITPGIYEHYKGKKYFVLGLSRNTESNEVCVVYRPLYETDWPHLVHRNAEMFFEKVEVGGKQLPRFRRVE